MHFTVLHSDHPFEYIRFFKLYDFVKKLAKNFVNFSVLWEIKGCQVHTPKKQKDFWTGVMFVAFGMFFAILGTQYKAGTAAKMGPGYFPRLLSVMLILIGMILLIGGLFTRSIGESVSQFNWRTLMLIIGPVLLFGLLLEKLGVILSLFVLILVSSYASHEFKWKSTLINAVVLIVMCLVIFVWSLKLQFPIWPSFMSRQ